MWRRLAAGEISAFLLTEPDEGSDPARLRTTAVPDDNGDYLLNGVYGYAHNFPEVAPAGPTPDPGLNLLHSTVETMLGTYTHPLGRSHERIRQVIG